MYTVVYVWLYALSSLQTPYIAYYPDSPELYPNERRPNYMLLHQDDIYQEEIDNMCLMPGPLHFSVLLQPSSAMCMDHSYSGQGCPVPPKVTLEVNTDWHHTWTKNWQVQQQYCLMS